MVEAPNGLRCTLLNLKACLFAMRSDLWMKGVVRSMTSALGSSLALFLMYLLISVAAFAVFLSCQQGSSLHQEGLECLFL